MVNFKKIDEKDFVFINRPLMKKEDEAFSDFLKNRKKKQNKEQRPKLNRRYPNWYGVSH